MQIYTELQKGRSFCEIVERMMKLPPHPENKQVPKDKYRAPLPKYGHCIVGFSPVGLDYGKVNYILDRMGNVRVEFHTDVAQYANKMPEPT